MTGNDDTVCLITDLDVAFCAHCRNLTLDTEPDYSDIVVTLQAKYANTCRKCGNRWEVGDLISKTSYDIYIHQECPDD